MVTRFLSVFLGVLAVSALWADVKPAAIFSDNLVLRGGVPVPVWGKANPAEKVTVSFAGQTRETTTGQDGKWSVTLEPLAQSNAPAEMLVTGSKNTLTIKNVLVGDVWFSSGQSNMEMRVGGVNNAAAEIKAANYPEIRMFIVKRDLASSPREEGEGQWLVCNPKNVPKFSAASYFFARDIYQIHKIPLGIISTAVGSSSCEAWTPLEILKANAQPVPNPKIPLDKYTDLKTYKAYREGEINSVSAKDPGIKPECMEWAKPEFDDSAWKAYEVPGFFEQRGMKIDGAVWLRKTVDLPKDWAGKKLRLALGFIRQKDTTFFNGHKIGEKDNGIREYVPRTYVVPGEYVKAGKNVIAVRIFNGLGNGGFVPYPAPKKLYIDKKHSMDLTSDWKSAIEFSQKPGKLPFNIPRYQQLQTGFFNAMVAPFVKFPINGVIWYQGESNAGRYKQHDVLFPAMITAWRKLWGDPNLPFYFVQLAGYKKREANPTSPGWAHFRESQRKTLALPHTGMAVAIDIGDAKNVHPKNKQDVGKRLARWARRDCYGEKDLEVSGPLYASNAIEGDKIRLKFTHTKGGLKARKTPLKGFEIAGEDKKFVWADAKIDGDSVVVWSPKIKTPRYVRYAWANNPECDLRNGENLPAVPFRTDQ